MFTSLSEKQREIVFLKSNRVVIRACPGSGKTFTMAARLADKVQSWENAHTGIAALSFTNVAWEEISRNLPKFKIQSIQRPHFLGTIDSFINHHIFLPFGHLVMGCKCRPILVGEPYSAWIKTDQFDAFFPKLNYKIDGEIYDPSPSIAPRLPGGNEKFRTQVFRRKALLSKKGYATQDDANYFALKVLSDNPEICQALAERFSVLLIDEAQDTTEVQMAILDLLSKAGVQEIFMVGDPDQAIFEWNTADPKSFLEKCSEWGSRELDECRRSSAPICNFVHKLSSLNDPAVSVSPELLSCDIAPQILEYRDLTSAKEHFVDFCKASGVALNKENVAILCRTRNLVHEMTRTFNPSISAGDHSPFDLWKEAYYWSKDICEGGFLVEQGAYKDGYKLIERGCFKALYPDIHYSREALRACIRKLGLKNWRDLIHCVSKDIPASSNDLNSWLRAFSPIAEEYLNIEDMTGAVKDGGGLKVQEVFGKSNIETLLLEIPIRIGTIHSAKGETFEAVLVILQSKVKNKKYSTILKTYQPGTLLDEELRTIYVALTRPRRLLVLAVPAGDGRMWSNLLQFAPGCISLGS